MGKRQLRSACSALLRRPSELFLLRLGGQLARTSELRFPLKGASSSYVDSRSCVELKSATDLLPMSYRAGTTTTSHTQTSKSLLFRCRLIGNDRLFFFILCFRSLQSTPKRGSFFSTCLVASAMLRLVRPNSESANNLPLTRPLPLVLLLQLKAMIRLQCKHTFAFSLFMRTRLISALFLADFLYLSFSRFLHFAPSLSLSLFLSRNSHAYAPLKYAAGYVRQLPHEHVKPSFCLPA